MTIIANDIDIGDSLTYSDNTTLFDIDSVDGVISFTPQNADVGTYIINISVSDENGSTAYREVIFTILNVNDPPEIEALDTITAEVGVDFKYTVYATDEDKGDSLTFSDDTDLFDIDPDTGEISFTPSEKDGGIHHVTITATDEDGQTDQVTMTFIVPEVEEDKPHGYMWVLLIIMSSIALCIIYLLWKKKVKKDNNTGEPSEYVEFETSISSQQSAEEEPFEFEVNDEDNINSN